MPTGWTELLAHWQSVAAQASLRPEVAWQEFHALASRLRPDELRVFQDTLRSLTPPQRSGVAMFIAHLLAPLDWPVEAVALRFKTVQAIAHLRAEADRSNPDALPSVLSLSPADSDLQDAGLATLLDAKLLLDQPCRRDELRTVAHLCRVATFALTRAYSRALRNSGKQRSKRLEDALLRFKIAYQNYVFAVRDFNAAVDENIFQGLDLRIEED